MFSFKVPEGSPAFQKGYKDGCSTTLYTRGNQLYRDRYGRGKFGGYQYDASMIGNPEYRFGFSRGWAWCFQNIIGGSPLSSFDRYVAYKTTYDMNTADIGAAWGGMLGGSGGGLGASVGGNVTGVVDSVSGNVLSNPLWAGGSDGQFFGY